VPRPERGANPAAFRAQLLVRLRNEAQARGVSAQRLQQRVAFERFLVRLEASGEWVLKGGFALELRYGWHNRPTKDIDLRVTAPLHEAIVELRAQIAVTGIPDHFSFELGVSARELQGAPGGALRVPILARLDGEKFASFHIDISSGDALVATPHMIEGSDLMDFAGVRLLRFPIYPVEQHLAEKLHAYTLPRDDANTRVKDFVDLLTIASLEAVSGDLLAASVRATFDIRKTHDLPAHLPEPPDAWIGPFAKLTTEFPQATITNLADACLTSTRIAGALHHGRSYFQGDVASRIM